MAVPLSEVMRLLLWGGLLLPSQVLGQEGSRCRTEAVKVACIGSAEPRTIVCCSAAAEPKVKVRSGSGTVGGASQDPVEKVVVVGAASSQWIGVRLTPVPAPLAAHIGDKGMMIANIVKDSPADQAGLQQYDVIVAFDGRKVDDREGLLGAVGAAQIGHESQITIIRGAQQQELSITPAQRPSGSDWQYKYDEPAADVVDQSFNLRGHRLLLGPGGGWVWEELGPMQHIPDIFNQLKDLKDLQGLGLKGLDAKDLDVHVDVHSDLEDAEDSGGEAGARVEVRIEVDDNGQVTTICRDPEGNLCVQRTDPDGSTSTATYSSADELQRADPGAYQLYQQHGGGGTWIHMQPSADRLQKLQKDFQIDVHKRLKDAMDRAKQAQEQARTAEKEARKQIEKGAVRRHVEASSTGTLSVEIAEDGKITVTVGKGDRQTVYKFDSKEEFKNAEPELYERVRNLFE